VRLFRKPVGHICVQCMLFNTYRNVELCLETKATLRTFICCYLHPEGCELCIILERKVNTFLTQRTWRIARSLRWI